MLKDIKTAVRRSQDTLLGDFVGAAALMSSLFAGLHLPNVVVGAF